MDMGIIVSLKRQYKGQMLMILADLMEDWETVQPRVQAPMTSFFTATVPPPVGVEQQQGSPDVMIVDEPTVTVTWHVHCLTTDAKSIELNWGPPSPAIVPLQDQQDQPSPAEAPSQAIDCDGQGQPPATAELQDAETWDTNFENQRPSGDSQDISGFTQEMPANLCSYGQEPYTDTSGCDGGGPSGVANFDACAGTCTKGTLHHACQTRHRWMVSNGFVGEDMVSEYFWRGAKCCLDCLRLAAGSNV
mmetsp:Transcript_52912/g.107896  ORF Transcript_52912/g.107896 Transcript_52912/m.107896 type:complete len:247 (-) Transcript_52912:51-791(-)